VYSLIIRNRKPNIKSGDTLELEVFLSGYGVPEQHKLIVQWSSPYVIDKDNPGFFTTNIATATDKTGKITGVATGKPYVQKMNISPIGTTIVLGQAHFWEKPSDNTMPNNGLRGILSESEWDNEPPLFFKINTAKNAHSGDYDITFTFTYTNAKYVFQDYKTTPFHITSWWERNQFWIEIAVGAIALASLVITAISSFRK